MLKPIITALFGTRHQRELKRIMPIVDEINEHYQRLQGVSDEEFLGQTPRFRGMLAERTADLERQIAELRERKRTSPDAAEREEIDVSLQGLDGRGGLEGDLREEIADALRDMLPEAFATVREACRRLLGTEVPVTGQELRWDMVPYDVQLIGGLQLHRGRIAEMATGEGKTLVATLPLYLNALAGRGAHLVTVNSYLARRDSQWMGHVYRYLGLTVGCIDDTEPGTAQRREAYLCDITYGTNNEFGFDYLRDNMVGSLDQRVQRPHWYAIVDEVDSVLIDEARTPLIISGPVGNENNTMYREYNGSVVRLARAQSELVNTLVAEAERAFEQGDTDTAGLRLFQAKLGSPKNRRLLKVLQEQGAAQLVQKVELSYLADRKLSVSRQQFRDVEDRLLFVLDEKGHAVHLTDRGVDYLSPAQPDAFVLPDLYASVHEIEQDPDLTPEEKLERKAELERDYAATSERLHIVHQLLRAHALYERDVNYVVQEGQVLIVDEFTGRTMPGRRWSEGLHQAVEAKEAVQVKGETQTMATITIQNYFRMYEKLAGMTGTAETEEGEFHQIYHLDVSVIPTNKPIQRDDRQDLIYKTRREKYQAILSEVERLHKLGYPVLVGTTSVDVSETLSRMFKLRGLKHEVLNAKYHQREAEIVAMAGQVGGITIATNMAGRGTDIKLNPDVIPAKPSVVTDPEGREVEIEEMGGLHIIGSERHESRRIDRQLRGRAGRQGDPGASQFFLSLEDDLMRIFGSERIAKLMDRLGAQDGEVLTHPLITRSIEQAQKRVELQNFQTRKRLLEYDDVMNQQREVIYSLRSFALEGGEELKGEARRMVARALDSRVEKALAATESPEDWDLPLLRQELTMHYMLEVPELAEDASEPAMSVEEARSAATATGERGFDSKLEGLVKVGEQVQDPSLPDRFLSYMMLQVIDQKWKDHLYDLDQLRAAIHYRSWGQKDPLVEYKQEAFTMFEDLMRDIYSTFAENFMRGQIVVEGAASEPPPPPQRPTRRYNALGVLEDIPQGASGVDGDGKPEDAVLDIGPSEPPKQAPAVRREAVIRGAGSLHDMGGSSTGPVDWSAVGRNDACPCGSGKKFKKCHGAAMR